MFIQTEATPNPATLKFLPGRAVMPDGTLDLRDVGDAERSPLAQRLFGVSGVSGVFLGSDFITVTKSDGEWPHLKPAILGAIMEHFMSGAPVLAAGSAADVIEEGRDLLDLALIQPIAGRYEFRLTARDLFNQPTRVSQGGLPTRATAYGRSVSVGFSARF